MLIEEILEIVKELRLKLPDDIKQAKWVKEERQRILTDAQKEANNLIKDAEGKIASMVNEHEITKGLTNRPTRSSPQHRKMPVRSGWELKSMLTIYSAKWRRSLAIPLL